MKGKKHRKDSGYVHRIRVYSFKPSGTERDAIGVGVDVSTLALEVAKRNIVSLNLEKRHNLVESDLFSNPLFKRKHWQRPATI